MKIELIEDQAGTTMIFLSNILLGIKMIDRIIDYDNQSLFNKFFKSDYEKTE